MSYPASTMSAETTTADMPSAQMPTASRSAARRSAPTECDERETERMTRHPISRLYMGWLVVRLSRLLAPTAVRPWHLTVAGAGLSALAVTTLIALPTAHTWAAVWVWGAWLCDRLDGALARRQQSATAGGAWLDGNLDEAADIALHIAIAVAAAALWPAATTWVWALLITFVAAKYLLMHGLWTEANLRAAADTPRSHARAESATPDAVSMSPGSAMRRLYHLPGNADVRVHVLILALATGWLIPELLFVAGYYALRVAVRYPLVVARLKGGAA